MGALFRARLYELRKSCISYLPGVIITALFLVAMTYLLMSEGTGADIRGVCLILTENPGFIFLFPVFLSGMVAGSICAGDMNEGMLSAELLSGHSRISIYIARCVPAMVITPLIMLGLSFVPLLSAYLMEGWGDVLDVSLTLKRLLLMAFPYLRICALMCFAGFLCKNRYAVMVLSAVYAVGMSIISEGVDAYSYLSAYYNLNLLLRFKSFAVYNLSSMQGIVEYAAYEAMLPAGAAEKTIFISLLMVFIYLLMGYALYRREDMR